MSTLESLYCCHFTSSTRLIKPNYVRLLLSACPVFDSITWTYTLLTKNIDEDSANAGDTVYRRIKIEIARVVKPFIIKSSYRLVQITVKIRQRFCCFYMERDSSIPQLHTRQRRTSLNLCRFQVRSMSLVEFFARSKIPRSIFITAYSIYPFKDVVWLLNDGPVQNGEQVECFSIALPMGRVFRCSKSMSRGSNNLVWSWNASCYVATVFSLPSCRWVQAHLAPK